MVVRTAVRPLKASGGGALMRVGTVVEQTEERPAGGAGVDV